MIRMIGEAPGRNGEGPPLHNAVKRWADMAGLVVDDFKAVERVNLLREWPGKSGKGSRFPMDDAARNAAYHRLALDYTWHVKAVVLVGWRVAEAFKVPGTVLPCQWFRDRDLGWLAVVPHPSGVNRWYNDNVNADMAADFILSVVRLSQNPEKLDTFARRGLQLDDLRDAIDSADSAIARAAITRIRKAAVAQRLRRALDLPSTDVVREEQVVAQYLARFGKAHVEQGQQLVEFVMNMGRLA